MTSSMAPPDSSSGPSPFPRRGSDQPTAPQMVRALATVLPSRRRWWPWVATGLFVLGVLCIGVVIANRSIHIQHPWHQVLTVQTFLSNYAQRTGIGLLAAAAALVMVGVAGRILLKRRRRLRASVLAVTSATLHVPPVQLTLRRARWARRGGGLRSMEVKYRPSTAVLSDYSDALTKALSPYVAVPINASWVKNKDRFAVNPKPVTPLRLEEKHDQLKNLVAALRHIIGEISVDQRLTNVADDGSVQHLVASYTMTTRDIGEGFRQRVQTVLDKKAPAATGYWDVRWDTAKNRVDITPAAPLPTKASYPTDLVPGRDDQMLIPLGVGDGGKLVYWNPKVLPHMLVVGPTGTGKTIFLFSLIISCLMRGWIIVLLDPKELSFRGFDPRSLTGRGLPVWGGIEAVATSDDEMEDAIKWFHANMRNRYAALKGFHVSEDDLPPVLMIVDETGELVERLTEYHTSEDKMADLIAKAAAEGEDADSIAKPKGTKNPELRKVWSGLRLGRQSKDEVVVATQRPDVSFIPGEARSNLTTRVGLGHLEGATLEMAFGTRSVQQRAFDHGVNPATGERVVTRVRGRATVDVGQGPQTIQTFWVPDPGDAILGKLSGVDAKFLEVIRPLIAQRAALWSDQVEAEPVQDPKTLRNVARELARAERLVEDSEDSPDRGVVDFEGAGLELCKVGRLEVGQEVLIEVDGTSSRAVITELEDDEYSVDEESGEMTEVQLTYQVLDGGPLAGQIGVTSFGREEEIPAGSI
jgi:hypothetical protein